MPQIEFSDQDMLRNIVVEPAYYLVRIDSIGEATSKDGGSTNYPVEATIIKNADTGDVKFANIPIEWNFNSKYKSAIQWFLEALGQKVEAKKRFELSNAAGKHIEVFVENGEWQGRFRNQVNHKYRTARSA